MSTVLITGATGYLGGRIALSLMANDSYTVRLAGHSADKPQPDWSENSEFVYLDLLEPDNAKEICSGVDAVIHLAAVDENVSALHPEYALMVNTLGTKHLVDAAVACEVKKFVYFSTIHVYGSPLEGTLSEESLTRPSHPYAQTHKFAEDFVFAAHDRGDLSGVVLRLSNAVGAPAGPEVDRWTLVVNELCRQAVDERVLSLKSSGIQQRDFIGMSNVTRVVEHMLHLSRDELGNGLFQVGSGLSISVYEMATLIRNRCQQVLDFTPELNRPEPEPDENASPLVYSIDKLRGTGFMMDSSIENEIDETLQFCSLHFQVRC